MTKRLFRNGTIYAQGRLQPMDVVVENGRFVSIFPASPSSSFVSSPTSGFDAVVDCTGLFLFPGFTDLHVHFREPGFSYKETLATGTLAAAHGGYTVCGTMPNLNPVPDSLEHLNIQRDIIRRDALVHVLPYGAITKKEAGSELADMEAMAPYVIGFTDDGVGVANEEMMRRAMLRAKALDKPIVAHAEEIGLVRGGLIHDGTYARRHHIPGNPSESEWKQVERDIRLAEETGAQYHVCHISTKESVALVREAQGRGLAVSGETGPHYLTLTDEDLQDDGRFRMNPPIRSGADREALREGIADHTLLAIATDHAPHSAEEKSKGFRSANGVVGLETAFPVLYTELVLPGILPLERILEALTEPVEAWGLDAIEEAREGLGVSRGILEGEPADFAIWDLDSAWTISPEDFLSKGKASPFTGHTVRGVCLATFVGGQAVYTNPKKNLVKGDSHE